jgi:hypothetical protein
MLGQQIMPEMNQMRFLSGRLLLSLLTLVVTNPSLSDEIIVLLLILHAGIKISILFKDSRRG